MLGALLMCAGLASCNPIEGYRSLSGLDKNDPDPETALFSVDLAKGEAGEYPNLATVPPPPVVSTTTADRQKLAQNLITERAATQAPDAQGRPGSPASGPVPPPPPIPAPSDAPSLAALSAVPAAEPPPAKPTNRKNDEPPLPGPLEASLQSPGIATLPNVEPPHSAPPPLQMRAVPPVVPAPLAPGAIQSGNPEPAPAPPVLPEARPSPAAAARPEPKIPPVGTTIADLDVPAGVTALAAGERRQLDQVLALYWEKPTTIRIVAFAAPATGSAEQLNSFRAALDRAQIVAKQLTDAGVPAKQVQTEASPAGASTPAGRVEVQFLP